MIGEQEREVLAILEAAVAKLTRIGLDEATISDLFLAYGIRLGFLLKGDGVFAAAREVIGKGEPD